MNRQIYLISYDLFKLVVALILLVILIVLLMQSPQPALPAVASINPTTTDLPLAQPTATAPATATPTFEPAQTLEPTPTATQSPNIPLESSPTLAPTATPEAVTTPVTSTAQTVECPVNLPAHLKVGDRVRVTRNLNMRSSPEISNNLITTNITGAQLEIIGGPVCGLFQGKAYMWWQVRRSDGKEGWSAEAPINEKLYFMETIK